MGSRPYAVLAYGYDISDEVNSWDTVPAWHDEDSEDSRYESACRHLLAMVGKVVAPGDYFDPSTVSELCDVSLINLGYSSESPVILAAHNYETDWDDIKRLPRLSGSIEDENRLRRALRDLDITRDTEPTWLLGTYYG